jgi:hypothetical protein
MLSSLNNFMYHLLILLLTAGTFAAAGLSYQHHPVFMALQMCVLGDVVLKIHKSTDAFRSVQGKNRTNKWDGCHLVL